MNTVASNVKDTIFSTKEAADYLGLAEDTVRQYIRRGVMSAEKIGPVYIVTKQECDRYLQERASPGNPNFVKR